MLLVLFSGSDAPRVLAPRGELRAGGVLFSLMAWIRLVGSCSSPAEQHFH